MMFKRIPALCCCFLVSAVSAPALDLWLYPEAADKNALFAGALFSVSLSNGFGLYPEFYLDYVLPLGLPFSAGAAAKALDPGFRSFAFRPAYHIDLNSETLDVYVLFPFEFYFIGRDILLEYGPRAGLRALIGRFFCITVETGYKLRSLSFGLSLKLN